MSGVSLGHGSTRLPLHIFSASFKLLLLLLALLSTSYSLISDPHPDIQTINWFPASLKVERSPKNSQRYGNTPILSAFLAHFVFPPTWGESPLVFCRFSDVFQLCFCLGGSRCRSLAGLRKVSCEVWRSIYSVKKTDKVLKSKSWVCSL